MKLTVELVPKSAHFKNLRSYLTAAQWDVVRKRCYTNARYRCEICNGVGYKWPVECHEVWEYDFPRIILKDLVALCPDCHMVKHVGFAILQGNKKHAFMHFSRINECTYVDTIKYMAEQFKEYHNRSLEPWHLDIPSINAVLAHYLE